MISLKRLFFPLVKRIFRVAIIAAQIAEGQPDKDARFTRPGALSLDGMINLINCERSFLAGSFIERWTLNVGRWTFPSGFRFDNVSRSPCKIESTCALRRCVPATKRPLSPTSAQAILSGGHRRSRSRAGKGRHRHCRARRPLLRSTRRWLGQPAGRATGLGGGRHRSRCS